MMPSCDHTGTPRHFHSSTTSGSACLISARTRASISPRQSLSSLIRASIKREGDAVLVAAVFFTGFFILLGAFKLFVAIDHDRKFLSSDFGHLRNGAHYSLHQARRVKYNQASAWRALNFQI